MSDSLIPFLCRRVTRKKSSVVFAVIFMLLFVVRDNWKIVSNRQHEKSIAHFILDNSSSSATCVDGQVVLSSQLDSRPAWKGDKECEHFQISHMIPKCRKPTALASYPGSGNTWLRYLIEGAGGVFTGSRYKDLQIQMFGFWGEIRNWADGSTIVQKTHDASEHHVNRDFGGRGVLVLRNPYEAILSTHNFLYSGHHGKAPSQNFNKTEWQQFVTIQASKWLDMTSNWTIHSTPKKVHVLHYENLKSDLRSEITKLLKFLHLPVDEARLYCMMKHSGGLFKRSKSMLTDLVVPFTVEMRSQLDNLITHVNQKILIPRGYTPMPLKKYKYFKKSNDEILRDIDASNKKLKESTDKAEDIIQVDRIHGTQMVVKEYIAWLESEEKLKKEGKTSVDDGLTSIMKTIFGIVGKPKDKESLESLSKKAEGVLSMAVEWWPRLQRPFAKDPIQDAIETDGFRGKEISDLFLPE